MGKKQVSHREKWEIQIGHTQVKWCLTYDESQG